LPESEEYETVGGLLFTRLGRVPAPGEHWDHDGVRFTVLDSDERRVHMVKVTVRRESA
jgi:CBS domain containing-hemolysin-like protein